MVVDSEEAVEKSSDSLESGSGIGNEEYNNDFCAQELLDKLDRYSDKRYVYVYDDDIDTSFDIDEEDDDDDYDNLWYIGNDGYLYIDMSYEEDE